MGDVDIFFYLPKSPRIPWTIFQSYHPCLKMADAMQNLRGNSIFFWPCIEPRQARRGVSKRNFLEFFHTIELTSSESNSIYKYQII